MMLVRRAHAAFDASDAALVIAVGGDGTLLAASHSVSETPILGVNSAPRHSVGFFCALNRSTFQRGLDGRPRGPPAERRAHAHERARQRPSALESRLERSALRAPLPRGDLALHSPASARPRRATLERLLDRASRRARPPRRSSAGGRVLPLGSSKLQLVVREPYVPRGQTLPLRARAREPAENPCASKARWTTRASSSTAPNATSRCASATTHVPRVGRAAAPSGSSRTRRR